MNSWSDARRRTVAQWQAITASPPATSTRSTCSEVNAADALCAEAAAAH
jgi:hypothetical protein